MSGIANEGGGVVGGRGDSATALPAPRSQREGQPERRPRGRGSRPVHGHPRRDDRQRRAADDPERRSVSPIRACSWVLNAYTLMFGGFLLLGGRLADRLGRRRLFVAGIALFSGASLVCGLAQSEGMLLVARGAQGLGGAMVSPAALSIILTTLRGGARSETARWRSGARSPERAERSACSSAA